LCDKHRSRRTRAVFSAVIGTCGGWRVFAKIDDAAGRATERVSGWDTFNAHRCAAK